MRVVFFCHSLLSDWNHGNAHFLRGVVTELAARGHDVRVYEPRDAWSAVNLERDHGGAALELAMKVYPAVRPVRYEAGSLDLDEVLDHADLVIVHEWNEHDLVRRIGQHRTRSARSSSYRLLFHDTHHRSVTEPEAMKRYDLDGYDGVLAFGAAVADVYAAHGWSRRAWVWHEAADIRVFSPPSEAPSRRGDVVWVGNWGDDERTAELSEMFLEPVRELGVVAHVHGVRYPEAALRLLEESGVGYGGWAPNFEVPAIFARYTMTVHVPRRPYATALPGIPTIRVFEALACGIPLVSAPWEDAEHLFRPGTDYLVARNGAEMRARIRAVLRDGDLRRALVQSGRETILRRHTCFHRVDELIAIVRSLGIAAHEANPRIPKEERPTP